MATNSETTTEQAQQPTNEYRWQCEKCGDTVPGLPGKHLNFCGHHPKRKGCNVRLVDETGQEVADSVKDAEHKGIFRKEVSKGNTGERSGSPRVSVSVRYLPFTIPRLRSPYAPIYRDVPEGYHKGERFPVKSL